MGSAVSAVQAEARKVDDEANRRTKEQLDFLVHAANSKLDHYQNELDLMFTDPASVEKKAVPGMRALRWERGYRVDVTNRVSDGLSEVVDSFFGIIDDATDGDTGANEKKKKVVGGFKKIVGNALSAILGNQNAGESEEQKFFIFMKQNAIIRIDVKIWRYNFSGTGVMAATENVFCYVFCTSVVDSAKIKTDEFSYLLTEYAGDEGVTAYVEHLLEIWASIIRIQEFMNKSRLNVDFQQMRLGGTETKVIEHETTISQPLVT